jgi:AcrR family transcriptional regulator
MSLNEPLAVKPQRLGRLPDPSKHAGILDAAASLFLELGYAATTMDRVARAAGVAKMTVYAHFPSKKELFAAIIDRLARNLTEAFEGMAFKELTLEEALRRAGKEYLAVALAPSSVALHRLIVAEASRQPGLGELIYRCGPAKVVGALADYLARQTRVSLADARLAAEQFLGAVLGHLQLRRLLDVSDCAVSRAALDRAVDNAVRLFLEGIGSGRTR